MTQKTIITEIKEGIEQALDKGRKSFIIFPFGDVGMQVKNILREAYGIEPVCILDNHLCKYNSAIQPLSFLSEIDCAKYSFILASTNPAVYEELKNALLEYLSPQNIVELECMKTRMPVIWQTRVGRYSYGPLAEKPSALVESIGNFCSFASGCKVVFNHPMNYITTHPLLFVGEERENPYKVNEAVPPLSYEAGFPSQRHS